MHKKISLYIPAYNAASTIKQVLTGVFSQTRMPDEVLVVDDGSADDTAKISREFNVRLITHKKNRGLSASRNTAIRESQFELVAALDADCVPENDWLEKLYAFLSANPELKGVGGKVLEKNKRGLADQWRCVHMKQQWGDASLKCVPFLYGSNTLYCREVLRKLKYSESLRTNYEDVDLSERMKSAGLSFGYCAQAECKHLRKDSLLSVLSTYCRWTSNPDPFLKGKSFLRSGFSHLYYAWISFARLVRCDIHSARIKFLVIDMLYWPCYLHRFLFRRQR